VIKTITMLLREQRKQKFKRSRHCHKIWAMELTESSEVRNEYMHSTVRLHAVVLGRQSERFYVEYSGLLTGHCWLDIKRLRQTEQLIGESRMLCVYTRSYQEMAHAGLAASVIRRRPAAGTAREVVILTSRLIAVRPVLFIMEVF